MLLIKIYGGICIYVFFIWDYLVIKMIKKKYICKINDCMEVLGIWEIVVLDDGWCELICKFYLGRV